jgi:chloramphenicol 3-O-phosphotransferase
MGHIILLNGIPAAGKSSVAAKLKVLRPRIQVVNGDAVIRATKPVADPVVFAKRALERVLRTVERRALRGPVVLDQAMPPNYLLQARTRFAGSCTAVLLTIDDDVRAARQRLRDAQGRRLTHTWNPGWAAFGQAADLHDLVLNANGPSRGGLDEDDCADAILKHVGSLV